MSVKPKIKDLIHTALSNLSIEGADFVLEHPADVAMGDYSTNVAMVLAKDLKTSPKELAEKIKAELDTIIKEKQEEFRIDHIEVAGPGFINFYLNRYFFEDSIKNIIDSKNFGQNDHFNNLGKKQKIIVEYTDPNPFKPFHIGHLMTNAIGESIARVVEFSGAQVLRANYQGDVGLHVAKAIYGLTKYPEYIKRDVSITEASVAIGLAYTRGAKEYEDSEEAKKEIGEINKKVYDKSDATINEVYDWGFRVTMEAFENLYRILGTQFDLYFLESEMAEAGLKMVRDNTGKAASRENDRRIFSESDGAIVFKAEEHDPKLHTRVFITKAGLPTYEAKELALTETKFEKVPDADQSIVITANEQADYMRVVAKAISLIHPEKENKMKHITHGMMRFATGKMGSRTGNVITGESLLRDVRGMIEEKIKDRDFTEGDREKVATSVAVAAIKYGILKGSTGGDIIFDFDQATSFEGDSGPYLQYSYARAKSLLQKAEGEGLYPNFETLPEIISGPEKLLYRFPEIVLRAAEEFEPHYIANYLIELAREYNSYYGNTKIIDKDDVTSGYKLALTEAYASVLKQGLYLLGIETPEKM